MKISYEISIQNNLKKWYAYQPDFVPKPVDCFSEIQDLLEMFNFDEYGGHFLVTFENDTQTETYCKALYQTEMQDKSGLVCIAFKDFSVQFDKLNSFENKILFNSNRISIDQIYDALESTFAVYSDIYVSDHADSILIAESALEKLHILKPQYITEYQNHIANPFDLSSYRKKDRKEL